MTTAELVQASKQNPQRPEDSGHFPSGHAPLYVEHEAADLRTKWQNIQGAFVDDPQGSVEQADQLVATAIQRLAEIFSTEKSKLQAAWSNGGEVSTEDMRQALRRYRSFFDRILSV